eukprot:gene23173-29367_t
MGAGASVSGKEDVQVGQTIQTNAGPIECHVHNCTLVIRSDELEVGDKVEMKPAGSALYFVGIVSAINPDCTCDIQMDGDDPDDIERNVNVDDIRKLMSKRALVVGRWRRAFMAVRATKKFNKTFGFAEDYGEGKTDSFHYDV